ncbi:ABC transporter permease [Peptostreptococcaceae bacterium AGR-M142]
MDFTKIDNKENLKTSFIKIDFKKHDFLKKLNFLKKSMVFFIPIVLYILFFFTEKLVISYFNVYKNEILLSPSLNHILGTDYFGKDMFYILIKACKNSLLIGYIASMSALLIGVAMGFLSSLNKILNYYITILIDVFNSIPSIIFLIFLQSFLKSNNIYIIALLIGLTMFTSYAKVSRNKIIEIKNKDFYRASFLMGANKLYLFKKHIYPYLKTQIMYIFAFNVGKAILLESSLSFFGFGISIQEYSLGSLLIDAKKSVFENKWWTFLFPGLSIIFLVYIMKFFAQKSEE